MQPYQKASEEIRRQSQIPQKIANTAISLGTGAIGGSALLGKIGSLLNSNIPNELMRKGLAKIDPRLGKMIETALDSGYDINQVRSFLDQKMMPEEEKQEKKHPNITQAQDLETRYPDIIKGLMGFIQQGQPPQAAAALMKNQDQYKSDIKKIEKETGKNFVDLILELMGPQNQPQEAAAQMAPPMQSGQMAPNEMQQMGIQPQAGGQQPAQMDPKLMDILNNVKGGLNRMLGRG